MYKLVAGGKQEQEEEEEQEEESAGFKAGGASVECRSWKAQRNQGDDSYTTATSSDTGALLHYGSICYCQHHL